MEFIITRKAKLKDLEYFQPAYVKNEKVCLGPTIKGLVKDVSIASESVVLLI